MTEQGFWLTIRFDEPVILSAHSSTAGDHETLDYVPGSALLGVAARTLYHRLENTDAWLVFQSGKVRFGNAYVLADDGSVTIPVPLSAYYPKVQGEDLAATDLYDLSSGSRPKNAGQLEQLRRNYMSGDGALVKVQVAHSLRTAIDDGSGAAKEKKLFGYSALPKGKTFASYVSFDADVEKSLVDKLRGVFGRTILLGRSRSAEFGRCSAQIGELSGKSYSDDTVQIGGHAIAYCLSDLALFDEYGMPVREPTGKHFGLVGGCIDWSRSHVRTRSYSPFNAAFRTYESERVVFEKGSVFVLKEVQAATRPSLVSVGAYRSAGLGRLWLSPPFLGNETVGHFATPHLPSVSSYHDARAERPVTEALAAMIAWRLGGYDSGASWAAKKRPELTELYANARSLVGASESVPVGPLPRQWARLSSLAEAHEDVPSFLKAVKDKEILRHVDRRTNAEIPDVAWGTNSQINNKFTTFAGWFDKVTNPNEADGPNTIDDVRAFLRLGFTVAKMSTETNRSGGEARA